MLLLDTNAVSELRRIQSNRADRSVMAWARKTPSSDMFISAISLLEIEQGILRIERRDPAQASVLRLWATDFVLANFKDRTLPVDAAVALRAAALHVPDPKPERDCLIAATALVHGMTVVTRNTRDFAPMGVSIQNPWLP